jgi:hypothetical protein
MLLFEVFYYSLPENELRSKKIYASSKGEALRLFEQDYNFISIEKIKKIS